MEKEKITIKNTNKEIYKMKIDSIYSKYNNEQIIDIVKGAQMELRGEKDGNESITELLDMFHTFIDMYVKFIYTPNYYNLSKTAYKMFSLLTPKGEKFNKFKISKLLGIIKNKYSYEELYNQFVIIFLNQIVKNYRHGIGTFIGYFFKYFTYRVVAWIKKEITNSKLESMHLIDQIYESEDTSWEEILDYLSFSCNDTPHDIMPQFMYIDDESVLNPKDNISKILTPEERNILNLRFNYGYTIAEVAEKLNINVRYLTPKIKEIYTKIRNYVKENKIEI